MFAPGVSESQTSTDLADRELVSISRSADGKLRFTDSFSCAGGGHCDLLKPWALLSGSIVPLGGIAKVAYGSPHTSGFAVAYGLGKLLNTKISASTLVYSIYSNTVTNGLVARHQGPGLSNFYQAMSHNEVVVSSGQAVMNLHFRIYKFQGSAAVILAEAKRTIRRPANSTPLRHVMAFTVNGDLLELNAQIPNADPVNLSINDAALPLPGSVGMRIMNRGTLSQYSVDEL